MDKQLAKIPVLTDRRFTNLQKAYSWIKFNRDSARVRVLGFGDKPAFNIQGTYKGTPVEYRQGTAAGGLSSLLVKEKIFRPAPLIDSKWIKVKVDTYLKVCAKLETFKNTKW